MKLAEIEQEALALSERLWFKTGLGISGAFG
jgi:hypothetical protein